MVVEIRFFWDLVESVSTNERIVELLQRVGLIHHQIRCVNRHCNGIMTPIRVNNIRIKIGFRFKCFRCKKRAAITRGSVLYNCKTPLRNIVIFIWFHALLEATVEYMFTRNVSRFYMQHLHYLRQHFHNLRQHTKQH